MAQERLILPEGYHPRLNVRDTQKGIKVIKDNFERYLAVALNLERVSAPLFVTLQSGFNDNLNGVERPVQFDILAMGEDVQVVQSLAKWKRWALGAYGFEPGRGLYTDMNAIRRDEDLDNLHSVYVDQWDWEKVITKEQRTPEYLMQTVRDIYDAVKQTARTACYEFSGVDFPLAEEIFFVTAQELEDLYPALTPKERENAFVKEHGTTFLMKIGGLLKSGKPHDGRAPDYDDWDLNGDLLFWNEPLQCSYELSSMGIRVSPESMDRQLTLAGCDDRRTLPFHKAVLAGELPYTIGGGIGQSRLCMLLLGSVHIGEVQASVWDEATREACAKAGIPLL